LPAFALAGAGEQHFPANIGTLTDVPDAA